MSKRFRSVSAFVMAVFLFIPSIAPVLAEEQVAEASEAPATVSEPTVSTDMPPETLTPTPVSEPIVSKEEEPTSEVPVSDEEKPKTEEEQSMMAMGDGSDGSGITTSSTIKTILPQASTASGALLYQYPLKVPPGRNGMQPDLQLTYSSQASQVQS